MKNARIPILGFAAHSGTGKTTLLIKLLPILKNAGLRIGLIKHSHHNFEIDKPNKDSHRLRTAGASPVMLVSSHRRAIMTDFTHKKEPSLNEQLKHFDQSELDLILVEGFKAEKFPKIELHRHSLKNKYLFINDPNIIAIAIDTKIILTESNTHISDSEINPIKIPTQLNINQPNEISHFILNYFSKAFGTMNKYSC